MLENVIPTASDRAFSWGLFDISALCFEHWDKNSQTCTVFLMNKNCLVDLEKTFPHLEIRLAAWSSQPMPGSLVVTLISGGLRRHRQTYI